MHQSSNIVLRLIECRRRIVRENKTVAYALQRDFVVSLYTGDSDVISSYHAISMPAVSPP